MVDPTPLDLIHAEIDGELDERQRSELSRCVLADPQVRALRDQMRRVCQALDAVEPVEAPPQLCAEILAALPQIQARKSNALGRQPQWRLAAMLAGVLLTGTIVFRLVDSQKQAASEMAGTLAAPRAPVTVDMVQLSQGPVAGRVSLVRDRDRLNLALELVTNASVDVLIASGGHTLRVNGLGSQANREAAPALIALPGFEGNGHPLNLTFLIGDQEVGRAVLREPKGH